MLLSLFTHYAMAGFLPQISPSDNSNWANANIWCVRITDWILYFAVFTKGESGKPFYVTFHKIT